MNPLFLNGEMKITGVNDPGDEDHLTLHDVQLALDKIKNAVTGKRKRRRVHCIGRIH